MTVRSGRIIGLSLMVVAGGWLLHDSLQPRNASFPPEMNTSGQLILWFGFVLGALVFLRDSYFKWREDQRAEKAAEREEERFRKDNAN